MTNETKKEVDIAEFKSLVESNHKILGLDIGSKKDWSCNFYIGYDGGSTIKNY